MARRKISGSGAERTFLRALKRERKTAQGAQSTALAARGIVRGGPSGKALTQLLQTYTVKGATARAGFRESDLAREQAEKFETGRLDLEKDRLKQSLIPGMLQQFSELGPEPSAPTFAGDTRGHVFAMQRHRKSLEAYRQRRGNLTEMYQALGLGTAPGF
jgi:hypothetical protein